MNKRTDQTNIKRIIALDSLLIYLTHFSTEIFNYDEEK